MNFNLALILASLACILLASLAGVELLRRRKMLPCFTAPFRAPHLAAGELDATSGHPPALKNFTVKPTPRRFTWPEVATSTANFTSAIIGNGGFSTVYAARLQDSTAAAVKLHHNSERLHRAFLMELDVLRHLHHPNIVRFLGYCDEKENQGVLIFEYIPNGSLHEKLHGDGDGDGDVLRWANRTLIAYRLAQALHYLHEGCELQIVHGDITASNVLLDGGLNPMLCDFGCSRMGFSALVCPPAAITGSPGYVDPHYIRTGIVSKKSDVYSFGVLLLELITGAEAFNGETERLLTAVAGGVFREGGKVNVAEIVDRRLAGEFDEGEAVVMASVAVQCIMENPSLRPSMAEVARVMEEKVIVNLNGRI